jgi:very-short-patch-repair endonuclease
MDVAVFLDGPIHDDEYQQQKDDKARAKLEDELGWLVLRFNYTDADAGWLTTIATHPDVFGTGKTGP